MTEITNPYAQETEKPLQVSDPVLKLAFYIQAALSAFLSVRLTSDEYDALAKIIAAVVRSHPWIKDVVK